MQNEEYFRAYTKYTQKTIDKDFVLHKEAKVWLK